MVAEAAERLRHIKNNIDNIRRLLSGRTIDDLRADNVVRAACERFLEIVSEASRHVPAEWKQSLGTDVPWQDVAAFGNILRHAYDQVDVEILWTVYRRDLDPLARAIDAMLAEHGP